MTSEETQVSDNLKGCYENLIVIDVGANLTNKKYGRDLDSVVQRAKDAGKKPKVGTEGLEMFSFLCVRGCNQSIFFTIQCLPPVVGSRFNLFIHLLNSCMNNILSFVAHIGIYYSNYMLIDVI